MLSTNKSPNFFSCKKWNYLSNAKNRTCLYFFLSKIFEFYFCHGNYASSIIFTTNFTFMCYRWKLETLKTGTRFKYSLKQRQKYWAELLKRTLRRVSRHGTYLKKFSWQLTCASCFTIKLSHVWILTVVWSTKIIIVSVCNMRSW